MSEAGPIQESERLLSIDVLRGFAVLGILVMNIQSFAMIGAAYMNPTAYGDLTGANYAVWYLSYLLVDLKFMTIFSMLFGAGIVVLTSRRERAGEDSAGVHYRRMAWLLVVGLAHAYLLWYGDILFSYAVCGLVAYVFRRLPPAPLIALGLCAIAVGSAIFLLFGLSMSLWPAESLEQMARDWSPTKEMYAAELAAYRGSWLEQMSHRVPESLFFQTFLLLIFTAWRAGGLMLVGMGLYKLGVLSAQRSGRFYLALVAAGVLIGLPLTALGIQRNFAAGWSLGYSFFLGMQFNYWGSLPAAMGWVGLIMLMCKRGAPRWLLGALAAVGRMALSCYLLETIICTAIFYGHGLGLFGRVERTGQLGVVLGVWAVLLAGAPLWLRFFRFGPFEWLWRTLTYMKPQPMLRR